MKATELQEFRRKRKISLTEVAANTGLPEAYLIQIEEGIIKAPEGDLARITKALVKIEAVRNQPDDDPEDK